MIKFPGTEMAIWTVLWMLAGSYVSIDAFMAGSYGSAFLFSVLPIGCALIWLDIREGKWLMIAYFVFAVLGGLAIAVTRGPTLIATLRTLIAAYCIYITAIWNGGPNSD